MLKAVILNDTRRNKGHPGCAEVMSNIEYLSELNSIQITKSYQRTDAFRCEDFEKTIENCNVVILNGEGTFHHDQAEAINLAKCVEIVYGLGKPCHLINCTWESNHLVNSMLPMLASIFVRDCRSRNEIAKLGFESTVSPDLSLYRRTAGFSAKGSGRSVTFVDSVYWRVTKKIATVAASLSEDLYVMAPHYWRKPKYARVHIQLGLRGRMIRKADVSSLQGLVVTGRFHGVCLAIRDGLPFLAVPSNTSKIESLISDIGISHEKFVIDASILSKDIVLEYIGSKRLLSDSERSLLSAYLHYAQSSSRAMFTSIAGLI